MTMQRAALMAMVAIAVCASAQAGGLESAIGACAAQPDAKVRLACYDDIAMRLRTAAPLPPAAPLTQAAPIAPPAPAAVAQAAPTPAAVTPTPVAAPPAQVAAAPRTSGSTWYDPTSWFGRDSDRTRTSTNPADFGAEGLRKADAGDQPEELEEIHAGVKAVAYGPTGRFTVSLDNGQVWKQIESDVTKSKLWRDGDTVTISRGALGSYNLVINGHAFLYKVKRLQ